MLIESSALFLILAFVFGCVIGSFLNVVILRLPEDEKLGGRSRCPWCGHTLSAWELVPVLSYFFLKGKCRNCHKKISSRYFIIEALTGLSFVWAASHFYPGSVETAVLLIKVWLIISILIAVFVIDLEHFLILDRVIIFGTVGVLLLNIAVDLIGKTSLFSWGGQTLPSVAAAVLCPLPFFLIWYFSKGRWMGFGDVKLAVFLGAALGWPLAGIGLLLAVFIGGAMGVVLLGFTDKTLKSRVPFGTFLSLGAFFTLFYGPFLLRWYLSFLGL